ncbi:T6SS immunity protein Tli4 family protein [Pseudomonas aeruginosa]|nr:T6SS immunity protein Tli4 family protein [Pseudomonas aeruginosa]
MPNEPGICFPYGFIADDGKTAYELKNSLRFTRTPNVIFSLLTASANDPWQTRPTSGLYDSDFRPGYDRQKWKKARCSTASTSASAWPPSKAGASTRAPTPANGNAPGSAWPIQAAPRSAGSDPGADLPERHRRPHRLHPAPRRSTAPPEGPGASIEQRLAR